MEAALFDHAAERLEHYTTLDRMEARGTLRIALKKAGLDSKRLTAGQLCVVLDKVLPGELEARAIEGATAICDTLGREISESRLIKETPNASDSYEVFRRIGDA